MSAFKSPKAAMNEKVLVEYKRDRNEWVVANARNGDVCTRLGCRGKASDRAPRIPEQDVEFLKACVSLRHYMDPACAECCAVPLHALPTINSAKAYRAADRWRRTLLLTFVTCGVQELLCPPTPL